MGRADAVMTGEGTACVPVAVGTTAGVLVDVAVGGVPVAVGPGVLLIEPLKRNIWSGSRNIMWQEEARIPQPVQVLPKAPPGLRQAAPLYAVEERSRQNHCPSGSRSWLACTSSQ